MVSHVMVEANTIRAQHADKLRDSVQDRAPGGLCSASDDDAQRVLPPRQTRDGRAQRAFSVSPTRRQVWTSFPGRGFSFLGDKKGLASSAAAATY
jgi:hypothetical protein